MTKTIFRHVLMTKISTIIGLTALALGGCAANGPVYYANDHNTRINVSESIERLELFTQPGGLQLGARDKDAISQFMRQFAANGDGAMFINMPSNANGAAASQARTILSQAMAYNGLPQSALNTGTYYAAAGAPAPIVVSFRRLSVDPIHCPPLSDLTETYKNAPHRGYGCFAASNLAAMVQDPRQFLSPYDVTPADSARRSVGYTRYIDGENPASDQPERQENKSTQSESGS